MNKPGSWAVHGPIYKARREKLYEYTANPQQQRRSVRLDGEKSRQIDFCSYVISEAAIFMNNPG